mmetsp:Transcript_20493/g.60621  ORF Transcript_20493/g.60621 Transcript_20493/m.60621 type:complete len:243 (+) Transcript_20493:488-1216(+)
MQGDGCRRDHVLCSAGRAHESGLWVWLCTHTRDTLSESETTSHDTPCGEEMHVCVYTRRGSLFHRHTQLAHSNKRHTVCSHVGLSGHAQYSVEGVPPARTTPRASAREWREEGRASQGQGLSPIRRPRQAEGLLRLRVRLRRLAQRLLVDADLEQRKGVAAPHQQRQEVVAAGAQPLGLEGRRVLVLEGRPGVHRAQLRQQRPVRREGLLGLDARQRREGVHTLVQRRQLALQVRARTPVRA